MQNPSVRPGRSPRARPTGAPQSEREQNRLRSGTSGFSMTAVRGSGRGTSGTCTRPAPSRLRPEALVDLAEERTDTDCAPVRPESDRDRESRPDTERREVDERDEDREDACELLRADALLEPRLPRPPPATPVGGELTIPFGETTGARPQVSQYSSPPPMSS
ncbi:hypothetical protein AMK30_08490 [Streptomyces sp. CB02460]|nr:hypothetical protein AMK30_08490 [Streptomyces sp. CB02460]